MFEFLPLYISLSPTLQVIAWVVGILVFSGILMWPLSIIVASFCIYDQTLRRKTKEQWSRVPSEFDEDTTKMYNVGMQWYEKNSSRKREVSITNDGLKLFGEYYDFGNDRCVIIFAGRTDSLSYGYYFADIYVDSGYNLLLIDARAHGLSDGEFNTIGFEESKDAIAWTKLLCNEMNVRSVLYHGNCIGCATAMYAITSEDCPDCVEGMVAEGMFPNFGESMKNHLIERKKPIFMLYGMINFWMKHYTGYTMDRGPINVIDKMNKPLLMLHGKEDLYSTPEYAQKLYDLASSESKEIVWFEHGRHSMLRVTDTEKYDGAIKSFLARNFDTVITK